MPHSNIGALMSAEHEIAAPVLLARETPSPWQSLRTSRARRWLNSLIGAWREGMALYVRAGIYRGPRGWF